VQRPGSELTEKASRVAVELDGRKPTGWIVRHSCDNPPCVNPDHLLIGTSADNTQDMLDRGRAPSQRILSLESVEAIRSDPRSLRAIAADYGVGHMTISRMKK